MLSNIALGRHAITKLKGALSKERKECCVFWTAFGCCAQPKADPNTFLNIFRHFLYIWPAFGCSAHQTLVKICFFMINDIILAWRPEQDDKIELTIVHIVPVWELVQIL